MFKAAVAATGTVSITNSAPELVTHKLNEKEYNAQHEMIKESLVIICAAFPPEDHAKHVDHLSHLFDEWLQCVIRCSADTRLNRIVES